MHTVVFLCQHGGAKSLIAAEHFRRLAAQRGLQASSVCAGVEPYPEVPAAVVSGLAEEGIDVGGYTPRQVTPDMFGAATLLVHFGCDLSALEPGDVQMEDWGDVPPVSDGFERAHDLIVGRVQLLVETLVKHGSGHGSGV